MPPVIEDLETCRRLLGRPKLGKIFLENARIHVKYLASEVKSLCKMHHQLEQAEADERGMRSYPTEPIITTCFLFGREIPRPANIQMKVPDARHYKEQHRAMGQIEKLLE
jgi:hypothetical protein